MKKGNHRYQKIVMYDIDMEYDDEVYSKDVTVTAKFTFKNLNKRKCKYIEGKFKKERFGQPKKVRQTRKDRLRDSTVNLSPIRGDGPLYLSPYYYNERIQFLKDGTWQVYYYSTASDSPMSYASIKRGQYIVVGDTIKAMVFTKSTTLRQYEKYLDQMAPSSFLKPKEYQYLIQSQDTLIELPEDEYGAPVYYGRY